MQSTLVFVSLLAICIGVLIESVALLLARFFSNKNKVIKLIYILGETLLTPFLIIPVWALTFSLAWSENIDHCNYTPTCKIYFAECLVEYGFVLGLLLGSKRVASCNPWMRGGSDPVPILWLRKENNLWPRNIITNMGIEFLNKIWTHLSYAIPSTLNFKRKILIKALKIARGRLRTFKQINSLDPETKEKLLTQIRHYECKLALIVQEFRTRDEYVRKIWYTISAITFIIIPYILAIYLLPTIFLFDWFFYLFMLGAWSILLFTPRSFNLSRLNTNLSILVSIQLIHAALTYAFAQASSVQELFGIVAYMQSFNIWIMLWIVYVVCRIILLKSANKKLHASPEANVTSSLVGILLLTEKNLSTWTSLEYKKTILRELEDIAESIEIHLPKQLQGRDIATEIWLKTTASEVATSFREKKKWILTPRADTRSHFIQFVANSLVHIASGNWDSLEKITPNKSSDTKIGKNKTEIIKTLLTSCIPLIIFTIIQQSPIAIHSNFADYITLGVIIWLLVSLISILDPSYNDKISSLKNISNMFSGK